MRGWRQENPSKTAIYNHRNKLHRYGLTPAQYDKIYDQQEGKCAICRSGDPGNGKSTMGIDHNHKTGKVRALLCGHCNAGIGQFREDANLMLKAIEYLRKHQP